MRKPRLAQLVAARLREWIESGQLPPGSRLKPEAELAAELGVSRTTLREALRILEEEALITRHHGIGSFVTPHTQAIRAGLERLESFTEAIRRSGHRAEDRVLDIRPTALPEAIARALGVEPGSSGHLIISVRTSDGVPVIYSRDYVPAGALPEAVKIEGRRRYDSLLRFFSEEVGAAVQYAILSIRAAMPDPETQAALGVAAGTPLVVLEGTAYDAGGKALYWAQTSVRSEVYQFTLVRRR
ncbi:MAG: GntR family transcriptional regulator [Limnochordales bacterium]|nr:GntR family transcriptional regulator [Limnochordales bacterium]